MDRGYKNSFNRTITNLPELEKVSLGSPFHLQPGVLARIACYRLERWSAISAFLADRNARCTLRHARTSSGVTFRGEARWRNGFRPVGLQFCELRWTSTAGKARVATVTLPQGQ